MKVPGLIFWLSSVFILYVYIGYPLSLIILANLVPRPPKYPPNTPKVSMLIAAYNEQDIIDAKLENTLALDYPPEKLQIVVAADGSSDNTPNIVKNYGTRGVELSHQPERRGKWLRLIAPSQLRRIRLSYFQMPTICICRKHFVS